MTIPFPDTDHGAARFSPQPRPGPTLAFPISAQTFDFMRRVALASGAPAFPAQAVLRGALTHCSVLAADTGEETPGRYLAAYERPLSEMFVAAMNRDLPALTDLETVAALRATPFTVSYTVRDDDDETDVTVYGRQALEQRGVPVVVLRRLEELIDLADGTLWSSGDFTCRSEDMAAALEQQAAESAETFEHTRQAVAARWAALGVPVPDDCGPLTGPLAPGQASRAGR